MLLGLQETSLPGLRAYRVANADAYKTVYLTTIAFSGLAISLTFLAPNTEKYKTGKIMATLHNEENVVRKKVYGV